MREKMKLLGIFVFAILINEIYTVAVPCANGKYRCSDNPEVCLSADKLCNGIPYDCGKTPDHDNDDNSDEMLCDGIETCTNAGYDLSCFCDPGDSSCFGPDNSGPDNVPYNGPDEFCMNKTMICDGKIDCLNGNDERYCQTCKDYEFRCDSKVAGSNVTQTKCLTRFQLCDGRDDCDDGTDEGPGNCNDVTTGSAHTGCFTATGPSGNTLPDDHVICFDNDDVDGTGPTDDTACISKADVCKSSTLCPDVLRFCPTTVHDNEYLCWDGKTILGRAELCDGFDHCNDTLTGGTLSSSDEAVGLGCTFGSCVANDQVSCLESGGDNECIDKADLCPGTENNPLVYGGCDESGLLNGATSDNVNGYCAYVCSDTGKADCLVDEGNGICIATGDLETNFQCSCKDGYAHPVSDDGTINFQKCGVKCNATDDCGANAVGCEGTEAGHNCFCEKGYVDMSGSCTIPTNGCTKDSDCNPDGLTLHTCNMTTYICDCVGGSYDGGDGYCRFEEPDCHMLCYVDKNEPDGNKCMVVDGSNGTIIMCDCHSGSTHPRYNNGDIDDSKCGDNCHNDQCGPTGVCTGTVDNFICSCGEDNDSGIKYVNPVIEFNGQHYTDRSKCEEQCNTMVDCGAGAEGCMGSRSAFKCFCKSNFDHPSDDDKTCVEKCDTDITDFVSICGSNTTSCTPDKFVTDDDFCVCGAGSVKKNGKCVDDCYLEIEEHCGKGVSSCKGSDPEVTCFCHEGYELQEDGKCHELNCNERGFNPCIHGNCSGGYWSYTCKCEEDYRYDEKKRCCVAYFCDVKDCGHGYVHGKYLNFATGCNKGPGVDDVRTCDCRPKYFQKKSTSTGEICTISACSNAECSVDRTNTRAGTCFGDAIHFSCVCMEGFVLKEIQRHTYGPAIKVCAPIDCMDSYTTLCNGHADYCTGSVTNHKCHCKKGFINPTDGTVIDVMSCIPDLCDIEQCGPGAESCSFINTSPAEHALLQCNCTKFGYERNTVGDKCVPIPCDDAELADIEEACGGKATGCSGTLVDPKCECDEANHYYPTADFKKCVSSCLHNEETMLKCGKGNTCHGTYTDSECVCHAPGWVQDITDVTQCLEIYCNGTNRPSGVTEHQVALKACGKGATACEGTWNYPTTCTCMDGYVPSSITGKCVKDTCESSTEATYQCRLDAKNKCSGSLTNFKCQCSDKGFEKIGDACVEIECDSADELISGGITKMEYACGVGANDCQGTINHPRCHCDDTQDYYPSEDLTRCIKDPCNQYEDIREKCGKGNTCRGTKTEYICLCLSEHYTLHSNKQSCELRMCVTSMAVAICGDGATDCTGHTAYPTCICETANYIPSPDGKRCMHKDSIDCMYDETVRHACGKPNRCVGTKTNYVCDCSAYGWDYVDTDSKTCVQVACAGNHEKVCGVGSVSCSGFIGEHKCECNKVNHYIPSKDGKRCVKEPCQNNPDVRDMCRGNDCLGTYDDRECLCTRMGYTYGDNGGNIDKTTCVEIACTDPSVNEKIMDICGYGATGCVGFVPTRHCICNQTEGYVTSEDGRSCKPVDCKYNEAAIMGCGMENTCKGTFKSWVCMCSLKAGYEGNPATPQTCDEIMCTTDNMVAICGVGVTDCTGTKRNLTCYCDYSRQYVTAPDGKSCIQAGCMHNPESKKCGPGNSCFGTFSSFQCVCKAKGWEAVEDDLTACVETKCTKEIAVDVCGEGAVDCSGTVNHPHCECDTMNSYIEAPGGMTCMHLDCRYSMYAREACGPENSCEGSYKGFKCICQAKGFKHNFMEPRSCHEIMCEDGETDPEDICGKGATSCEGSARHPKCACDYARGYVPSNDGTSCELADCTGSEEAMMACGKGNKCQGTKDNFVCLCGYGWKRSHDGKSCEPKSCEGLDPTKFCGDGATDCLGMVNLPKCVCGMTGYQASADLHSCELMDCRFNGSITDLCGDGNACKGSIYSWECVCEGPVYAPDPDDKHTCDYAPCIRSQCGMDPKKGPLGYLGTCEGPYHSPTCTCIDGYKATDDDKFCVPEECDDADCGDGNCVGFKLDYYCHCNPGYIPNHDKTTCVQAPCKVEDCGFGIVNGRVQNYAKKCTGTIQSFTCECLNMDGFMISDGKCVQKPCAEHPHGDCGIGDTTTCQGDYYDFNCNCPEDFVVSTGDPHKCVEAKCLLENCGTKMVGTVKIFLAVNCMGTLNEFECMCKPGYGIENGVCVELPCSAVPNVCSGVGTCNADGTFFAHTCNCPGPEYTPDATNMKCVEAPCDDVQCGGTAMGKCKGTFVNHYCHCEVGNEIEYQAGKQTCVKASCRNEQCGGTAIAPHGTCENDFDNFLCTCLEGFYHPVLSDGTEILNKCDHICQSSQCSGSMITSCSGTISNFVCNCENGAAHPTDIHNNMIKTACEPECEIAKCNTDGNDATEACSGTVDNFECECKEDFDHPVDDDCKEIKTVCKPICNDMQCGMGKDRNDDDVLFGTCDGTEKQHSCNCNGGFKLAKDSNGRELHTLCKDINECEAESNPCGEAMCMNTLGSYYCMCEEGYAYFNMECYPNGGWSKYSYTDCSETCGGGTMDLTRECIIPSGDCVGDQNNHIGVSCNTFECEDICPVDEMRLNCGCEDFMEFPDSIDQMTHYDFFVKDTLKDLPSMREGLIYLTEMANKDICNPRNMDEEARNKLIEDAKSKQEKAMLLSTALNDFKAMLKKYISCRSNFNDALRQDLYMHFNHIVSYKIQVSFLYQDFGMTLRKLEMAVKKCGVNKEEEFEEWLNILSNYRYNKYDTTAFTHGMKQ